uniref:Ig-like domain-containing protein n=1 Tax=Anolis carolinensis TaxID=28377 RepID=A0A803T5D1_ANOCA
LVFRISGEKVLIPCEATNPQTRWFWFPLHSRCVNITGKSVEIIQNHTTHEVTPLQFNKRLNQAPESLFLMDLRLSDAGTYVCRLPNGSETRTTLWMTQGKTYILEFPALIFWVIWLCGRPACLHMMWSIMTLLPQFTHSAPCCPSSDSLTSRRAPWVKWGRSMVGRYATNTLASLCYIRNNGATTGLSHVATLTHV